MPLVIQRTASVYRLWNDDDVRELFESHANAGWLCTVTCIKDGDGVVWQVTLQNSSTRQLVQAPPSDVVISDLVTVESQTLLAYNLSNPNDVIEEPGS